jgi:acyl-CoA thioesterase I
MVASGGYGPPYNLLSMVSMVKFRNRWLVVGVGLSLGSLVLLTGCDLPSPDETRPPGEGISLGANAAPETNAADVNNLYRGTGQHIIAFGDSITAGAGVGPQAAYPQLLSEALGVPVLNRGRSGDTTATALARLQQDVIDADPWLVIIGLGGNDYLRQVPIAETAQNLRTIITTLQGAGAIVVLLGMDVDPFNGGYETLYQTLAQETQAYLIPEVLEGLNDSRYLYDRIHPNQAGHQILADRVAVGLDPLLAEATWPTVRSNP